MNEPSWLADDDDLIGELGAAVREDDAVPQGFRQIARDAYVWRTVDAELAQLAEDSALSGPVLRGDPRDLDGGPRSLSFVAGALTIELEIHPDAVRGQLVPAQPGAVRVQLDREETSDASETVAAQTIPVDDVGWFVVSPVPAGRFRLQVRTTLGTSVQTGWITPG
jgi:hypothetical protein